MTMKVLPATGVEFLITETAGLQKWIIQEKNGKHEWKVTKKKLEVV